MVFEKKGKAAQSTAWSINEVIITFVISKVIITIIKRSKCRIGIIRRNANTKWQLKFHVKFGICRAWEFQYTDTIATKQAVTNELSIKSALDAVNITLKILITE